MKKKNTRTISSSGYSLRVVVAHAFNPEVDLWVWGQPALNSEFQDS